MDSFIRWYRSNYTEITWFLMGWLSLDLLQEFNRENWPGVAFNAVLIALNYFLNKK